MRYMLLIYGDDEMYGPPPGTPEHAALLEEYFSLGRRLTSAGIDHTSDEIDRPATGKIVRVRDGARLVSDGPFIEAKEQLGGFYIVDVPTREDALAWAARIPGARTGAIEVRPIIEH